MVAVLAALPWNPPQQAHLLLPVSCLWLTPLNCHAPCRSAENFSSLFVPTVETTRLSYLLDLLVPNQHHVMFVGNSGGCMCCLLACLPARLPVRAHVER